MDAPIQPTQPPLGDRIIAVLLHLGVWFADVGLLVSVVLYGWLRRRSDYVYDQGKQAVAYQITVLLLSLIARLAVARAFAHLVPGGLAGQHPLELPLPFQLVYAAYVALQAYGLVGAVQAYQGRSFRYALIGPWIARLGA